MNYPARAVSTGCFGVEELTNGFIRKAAGWRRSRPGELARKSSSYADTLATEAAQHGF